MHLSAMDGAQHAFVAAAYGQLGDRTAAGAHVERIRSIDPDFTLDDFIATLHYARDEDIAHLREGLLKAGIEET